MKRFLCSIVLVLFVLLGFYSCKDNVVRPALTETQEFQSALTDKDTLQMLSLCDGCMDLLKNKDIEGAIAMLYEYDDSTRQVKPLSDATRTRYDRLFHRFPVLSYQRQKFTFMAEGLNDVKYEVVFAEEENPELNGVPKISFMFNPVKVDSVWYLTVKRADQDVSLIN